MFYHCEKRVIDTLNTKHKRWALTNEMLLSTGDDVLNKVKFMDECFVPKTKFLSYAREKTWSNI